MNPNNNGQMNMQGFTPQQQQVPNNMNPQQLNGFIPQVQNQASLPPQGNPQQWDLAQMMAHQQQQQMQMMQMMQQQQQQGLQMTPEQLQKMQAMQMQYMQMQQMMMPLMMQSQAMQPQPNMFMQPQQPQQQQQQQQPSMVVPVVQEKAAAEEQSAIDDGEDDWGDFEQATVVPQETAPPQETIPTPHVVEEAPVNIFGDLGLAPADEPVLEMAAWGAVEPTPSTQPNTTTTTSMVSQSENHAVAEDDFDDDFGDFESSAPPTSAVVKDEPIANIPTTTTAKTVAADDDDDFGNFEAFTSAEPVVTVAPSVNEAEEEEFGEFEAAFDNNEAVVAIDDPNPMFEAAFESVADTERAHETFSTLEQQQPQQQAEVEPTPMLDLFGDVGAKPVDAPVLELPPFEAVSPKLESEVDTAQEADVEEDFGDFETAEFGDFEGASVVESAVSALGEDDENVSDDVLNMTDTNNVSIALSDLADDDGRLEDEGALFEAAFDDEQSVVNEEEQDEEETVRPKTEAELLGAWTDLAPAASHKVANPYNDQTAAADDDGVYMEGVQGSTVVEETKEQQQEPKRPSLSANFDDLLGDVQTNELTLPSFDRSFSGVEEDDAKGLNRHNRAGSLAGFGNMLDTNQTNKAAVETDDADWTEEDGLKLVEALDFDVPPRSSSSVATENISSSSSSLEEALMLLVSEGRLEEAAQCARMVEMKMTISKLKEEKRAALEAAEEDEDELAHAMSVTRQIKAIVKQLAELNSEDAWHTPLPADTKTSMLSHTQLTELMKGRDVPDFAAGLTAASDADAFEVAVNTQRYWNVQLRRERGLLNDERRERFQLWSEMIIHIAVELNRCVCLLEKMSKLTGGAMTEETTEIVTGLLQSKLNYFDGVTGLWKLALRIQSSTTNLSVPGCGLERITTATSALSRLRSELEPYLSFWQCDPELNVAEDTHISCAVCLCPHAQGNHVSCVNFIHTHMPEAVYNTSLARVFSSR